MTIRTTRAKLRDEADRALNLINRGLEHLQNIDEIADSRSDFINEFLPMLVKSLLEWEKGFLMFRDGL